MSYKFKTGQKVWWWDSSAKKMRHVKIRAGWEQWLGNEYYEIEYEDGGVTVYRTAEGDNLSLSKIPGHYKCECGGDAVKCTKHMWYCPRFEE